MCTCTWVYVHVLCSTATLLFNLMFIHKLTIVMQYMCTLFAIIIEIDDRFLVCYVLMCSYLIIWDVRYLLCMPIFDSPSWIEIYIVVVVVVVMCCACVVNDIFPTNALGPIPSGVAVPSKGCQSLRVTWTPLTVTPPLTLNHYRVGFQLRGGSVQTVTTTSQDSYTLTGLAPATTYTVRVNAQTQLGYGFVCCFPTATTHNGKASDPLIH